MIKTNKVTAHMFDNDTNLVNVNIDLATIIGDYAFYNCQNLALPNFSNALTTIGAYAFAKCYQIKNVTIPNSVTSIGMCVFWDDDIEELLFPFVGRDRNRSYLNGNY